MQYKECRLRVAGSKLIQRSKKREKRGRTRQLGNAKSGLADWPEDKSQIGERSR